MVEGILYSSGAVRVYDAAIVVMVSLLLCNLVAVGVLMRDGRTMTTVELCSVAGAGSSWNRPERARSKALRSSSRHAPGSRKLEARAEGNSRRISI